MKYKIVVDSCCDLPRELRKDPHFQIVPLSIELDNEVLLDDDTFVQKSFLEKMKSSLKAPKTACPSPDSYLQAYNSDADYIFVITLSAILSGSYNSAFLAKQIFEENNVNKQVAIFNSRSASSGEVVIALKIHELAQSGLSFDEICDEVNAYIESMETYFVLDSLDNLKKSGRLSNISAAIASVLNIKPIMGGNKDGTIKKVEQARGIKKALSRMVEIIEAEGNNLQQRVLSIAHCNCYERALSLKEELMKRVRFKDIIIVDMAGVSTIYASDGGIVVAF